MLTLITNKKESLANSALNVIDNCFEKGIREELYQCPSLLETLYQALKLNFVPNVSLNVSALLRKVVENINIKKNEKIAKQFGSDAQKFA